MKKEQQAFINNVPPEVFHDICERLWKNKGFPLLGDMSSVILEEYNNEAIDVLLCSPDAPDDDD